MTGSLYQNCDSLDSERLRERLPQSLFTQAVHYVPVLGSTNAWAKELAKRGEAEGSLVITEKQTAGRGRMGRQWHSPFGVNILFSVLFRPPFTIDRVFSITMLSAASLVDAIRETTGLTALIKWPNDIYCNGKKMAGILTEFSAGTKSVEYVVVGIGINANWEPGAIQELRGLATSLMSEMGQPACREVVLSTILERLEKNYRLLLRGEDAVIRDRWNRHSMVVGKEVMIDPEGARIRAKAIGIDRNGALLIEEEGRTSSVVCGDVQVLFPSLRTSPD
ncbi:MAG: biotin--[acetyl-CoA-carboxylase] ligase [Thermodesulfobacteriota bacterium]